MSTAKAANTVDKTVAGDTATTADIADAANAATAVRAVFL